MDLQGGQWLALRIQMANLYPVWVMMEVKVMAEAIFLGVVLVVEVVVVLVAVVAGMELLVQ